MIHFLLLGHFDCEDDHIRFVREGRQWVKVVRQPLDPASIEEAVRETSGNREVNVPTALKEWNVRFDSRGYLMCDEYSHSREPIALFVALAEKTGADIWNDMGTIRLDPDQLLRQWGERRERAARHRGR
jgi:hypothetical protein